MTDLTTVSAQPSQQSGGVGRLINILAMFSTVLGMFFTFTAGILGFLVWKQNELRKKAEKDVRVIDGLRKGVKTTKAKLDEMVGVYHNILERMEVSLDKVETKGEVVEESMKQAKEDKKI